MLDRTGHSRTIGVVMLVAASLLWSLGGLAVKIAQISPVTFAFYRCLAASIPMAILALLIRGRRPPLGWMAVSAILYTNVVALLIASMTLSTAALGILLQYTSPAFCALFAWMFQRRRIARRTALAMGIAAVGIGIMIASEPPERGILGPVLGLISGIAFGALILVLEKIDTVTGGRASPFLIVFVNNAGAAAILFVIAASGGLLGIEPWKLVLVAATGFVQLAIPYVLFQLALRRVHPVDASLLTLLEPVCNPLWVAIFTIERPEAATLVGGAAILVAMVIEATRGNKDER